jgi:hypothetical protein
VQRWLLADTFKVDLALRTGYGHAPLGGVIVFLAGAV